MSDGESMPVGDSESMPARRREEQPGVPGGGAAAGRRVVRTGQEGRLVRVTKRLRFQDRVTEVTVEGRLLERRLVRTESALAGGEATRLWVEEVVIEKAGGEVSVVLVDRFTRVVEAEVGR